jgi:large subunit ribosomal protein L4
MAEAKSKMNAVAKKTVKKPAVKAPKAVAKTKAVKSGAKTAPKSEKTASANLTVSVYGLDGKSVGKISLPAEVFGQKINKKLLAQAVRVYQANKRQGNASTKTRGEVDGSSKKIYRQKGTGRARHGTLRAPIFVKGGIVHGPKPRDFSLDFPKKMRRLALFSALSSKLADEGLRVIGGFEKIEPKTKNFVAVLNKSSLMSGKRRILVVAPDSFESLKRGLRNVEGVRSVSVQRLNALDVLKSRQILFAKEAILEMEKVFIAKK